MIAWFYRFIRSIPHFGLIGAFKLFLASQTNHVVWIKPRGYAAPVLVRGGTSDPLVAYLVFCASDYPVVNLESIEWVIDAGANAGYFSVFAAHHYPNARILAIEPEGSNFETLKVNTLSCTRITPIRAGLWSETGNLIIQDLKAEKWCFRCESIAKEGAHEKEVIQAVTVKDLMVKHGFPRVDVFKIDIEGGELEVFSASDTGWIEKVRVLMIELHPKCWRSFFKAVDPYPYDCRQVGENIVVLLGDLSDKSGMLRKTLH